MGNAEYMGSTQTFTVKFTSLFKTLEFIMKSFIIVAACLIAAISAYPDISGTGELNHAFNNFENVKERDFQDTYGAPAAPVETSWGSDTSTSFDPSYGNQDTTFFPAGNNAGFGSNPVGVGFGVNGDLGYGNLNGGNGLTLKGGLGGISFNFIAAILALLGHNPIEDFKDWFASDAAEAARNISPEHVQLVLNKIEAFALKIGLPPMPQKPPETFPPNMFNWF